LKYFRLKVVTFMDHHKGEYVKNREKVDRGSRKGDREIRARDGATVK